MGDPTTSAQQDKYVAVIDQEMVTDEVRDIALKYDPLNQTGQDEGFHLTDDGELHINDEVVIEEHKIVANKIPTDAIEIVQLPAERGELVHQFGDNGFRLYELPGPSEGRVVGLLGPNGVGKSTALGILSRSLKPNLGDAAADPGWDTIVREFRGTAVQTYLERLRDGTVRTAYKPQRIDRIHDQYDGTVGDLLGDRDERGVGDALLERLDLTALTDRRVDDVSGGELQRVAVAATLVADADTYLIDEPSSYLDVDQRLTVAQTIQEFTGDSVALVVDHDLITLDVVADSVHVVYGEPAGFGVVSRPLSTRRGINQFLDGYLRDENVRIREQAIDFLQDSTRPADRGTDAFEFPTLKTSFESFSLRVEPGTLRDGEVLGILGRNGLGKTTFAKLLAGVLTPDEGEIGTDVRVSYKPQYLQPAFEGTVEELFASALDVSSRTVETDLRQSFDLDSLSERTVADLSGGELQRVSIALALGRDAQLYLLDEPSAYLDAQQRTAFGATLRQFVTRENVYCFVIEHDLLLLDYVSDRAVVFEGDPGTRGIGRSPQPVHHGINRFLQTVGVTFRKDPTTGRPRANKPGSQKDREQKSANDYYVV
ncbi:ribosome biogenesis/translation initiation ATPase RLI [Halocatena pleomorpha]|uniref:Ribosome biogenesis/translation initiation ATPase RLI n=1 Tax=Halocatena pleomorpha TaxID=1785090 RepID=A0A3P3RJQ5_9EURY|nr:ribosome biogenesis/translation initiation ATPase RLI [Halocatena pleomorpha]RRJ33767.1 ribosome biogenesis/translation initiation ATPase RLI [Halocatena pleomorpha]